ncbi:MAG: sulfite exporter TauE/SafE family protein [Myxococcota bacterium]|nr:sulfite exporter TauE/SafE family protein [Myxococcota bacterium]
MEAASPEAAALLVAILAVAAVVQGFLGFGFGIVAMSGLTLSHDLLHAAGVVNLAGILVSSTVLWRLRAHVLWRPALRMLPAIVVGVAVGVTALRALDREVMVRVLGATIVVISGWNLWTPRLRRDESARADVALGLLGGLLAGAFNTGGPPLVAHLYRRPDPPDAVKATIQVLFLSMSTLRAPMAAAQGLLSGAMLRDALLAAVFVVAGILLGIRLAQRLHPDHARRAAWLGLGALGLALLLR